MRSKEDIIYINGRFLTQNLTGVQRYAIEIVKQLDKMNVGVKFILLMPKVESKINIKLDNIEIQKIGKYKGHLWEQMSLPLFIKKNGRNRLLNLCNLAPIMYPGYITIHDISFKTHPEHLNWKFSLWYKIVTLLNIKRYKHIFVVSEFSKKEIIDNYKIDEAKLTVTYNSAEHMRNIIPDENILEKLNLNKKEFYFSLGNKSPHKNFKFIFQCAQNNPDKCFVVSGNENNKIFAKNENKNKPNNLIFTGYITDEEMVALYKKCKAFIFPSLYEGFGIPPLEAINVGCKNVILSNIPVLQEIYGSSVKYFDINNQDNESKNICKLSEKPIELDDIVSKYIWEKSAKILMKKMYERKK